MTKYKISLKNEAYIYKKIRKNFNAYKVSDNELRLLGFSEIQVSKISSIKNIGRMNGQVNRAINSLKAINRITELVEFKNNRDLTIDEDIELNNLYSRNKRISKKRINSRQVCIDNKLDDNFDNCLIRQVCIDSKLVDDDDVIVVSSSPLIQTKRVKDVKKRNRTTLYYNEKLDKTITKEEFVRDYCGGICSKSNVSHKAYKFGFIPKQSYDNMQQNKMYNPKETKISVQQSKPDDNNNSIEKPEEMKTENIKDKIIPIDTAILGHSFKDKTFVMMAKSYFEVLRKIFSHTEVEELPIPCPLVDHDKSLYPTINVFSHCIKLI